MNEWTAELKNAVKREQWRRRESDYRIDFFGEFVFKHIMSIILRSIDETKL